MLRESKRAFSPNNRCATVCQALQETVARLKGRDLECQSCFASSSSPNPTCRT
jgi:hypothetical protein